MSPVAAEIRPRQHHSIARKKPPVFQSVLWSGCFKNYLNRLEGLDKVKVSLPEPNKTAESCCTEYQKNPVGCFCSISTGSSVKLGKTAVRICRK